MTKKRKQPSLEEVLDRPWCYYCERDFDDQKVLASHQKAKHFRCKSCNRRLNTIGGLSVHLSQVHKETLDSVEEALPNRNNTQLEIFGMEGIPQEIMDQHRQRVIREYTEAHGHRQASNNHAGENVNKKPKLETKEEMKARLAAFKARKAAGELPTTANGNATPTQVEPEGPSLAVPHDHSQGLSQSPAPFQGGISGPPLPANQGNAYQDIAPPPGWQPPPGFQPPPSFQPSPGFPSSYQPYGQTGFPGPPQQHQSPFPHRVSSDLSDLISRACNIPLRDLYSSSPIYTRYSPYQQAAYGQPLAPSFSPPPGSFNGHQAGSPANGGPFPPPNRAPFAPPSGFHPPSQLFPPPASSLPPAPGLPRRPAFQPPEMSPTQFQQLHQGQQYEASRDPRHRTQRPSASQPSHTEADVDQLIADGVAYAAQQDQIHKQQVQAEEDREIRVEESEKRNDGMSKPYISSAPIRIVEEPIDHNTFAHADRWQKKSKTENFVLMYSDTENSPEEKMAKLSRYAFDPKKHADETALETTTEAVGANFTGPVVGEDDVVDNQGD